MRRRTRPNRFAGLSASAYILRDQCGRISIVDPELVPDRTKRTLVMAPRRRPDGSLAPHPPEATERLPSKWTNQVIVAEIDAADVPGALAAIKDAEARAGMVVPDDPAPVNVAQQGWEPPEAKMFVQVDHGRERYWRDATEEEFEDHKRRRGWYELGDAKEREPT